MELIKVFCLFIISIILIFNFKRYNDLLYPPVIQSGQWLLLLLLFILNEDIFVSISYEAYFIYTVGVLMFSIGALIATNKYDVTKKHKVYTINNDNIYFHLIFLISIFGFPLFLYKAYLLGNNGPIENFMINLRLSLTDDVNETGGYGIFAYLVPISMICLALQVIQDFDYRKRMKVIVTFIVVTTYALFSTGRTFLFLIFCIIFGILMITKKISVWKGLMYFILLGVTVFILMGMILQKGVNLELDFAEYIVTFYEIFKIYLLGSIPAFDIYINSKNDYMYGENMFRSVLVLLNKFGLTVSFPSLVKDYVYVPFPTNVYTIYQPYYADFGPLGAIIIQFFLGTWHGYIYKKAKNGSVYYSILYGIFMYPLIMQFFQDQYFSLTSQWIQFLLILSIYFWLAKPTKMIGNEVINNE